jgi:hypothetical protein
MLGWVVIFLNKRVVVGRDVGGQSQFVHDLHAIRILIIEPVVILLVVDLGVVVRSGSVVPIFVASAVVCAVTATAGAASAPSAAQR